MSVYRYCYFSFVIMGIAVLLAVNGYASDKPLETAIKPEKTTSLSQKEQQLMAQNSLEAAKKLDQRGMIYYEEGKYKQALPLLQRALVIREEQLGAEHLSIAASLNSLALLYKAMGAYQKAQPLYQRALAIKEKQLGTEHLSTASSLNNLAMLYKTMGAYQKAQPLYQHALDIKEKQLGAEHISTANSLNSLAMLYLATSAYQKAEPLFQRALAINEKQLGTEHLSTANSLNNLAGLYKTMGRYQKAEPLYQRALVIRETKLGAEHPSTATSLNNLAVLYKTMGRYQKAEPLYQRALAINKKQLGTEHSSTATSLNNLALLYREMGMYQKAEPLYQRALAINKKQLGTEHPSTAKSLNNLAGFYRAMGAYQKAESSYQRALAIREKQLGTEHSSTATSLNDLALLYKTMGKYQEAEPLYQRALAISKKQLGEKHSSTATNLDNLAVLYKTMGMHKKAEPLYQRALVIREKQLGAEHPSIATSLNNLAVLYKTMGRYQKAEPLYQRVLAIREKQLGAEHPLMAISLNNYASLLKHQNNPKSVIFFRKRAINVLQASRKTNKALSKELKTNFINSKESTYRQLVQQLLNQNRLQEAEHVMAMYKEKEVADYFTQDDTQKNNRPATLIDFNTEEQTWHKRYKNITHALYSNYQVYKKLNAKEKNEQTQTEKKQRKQLEKTLTENEASFKQFLIDIAKPWSKKTADLSGKKQADALQKTLAQLGKGAVILNYYVQEDKIRLLLTTPTKRVLRESTLSSKVLQEKISHYTTRLKQKQPVRHLSQELHKLLIDPIAADLKQANAKTVMLSLDHVLRYLPMAALHNGESYLIQRYQLSIYTPAVGYQALLANNHQQPQAIALGVTEAATINGVSFNALPNVYDEIKGIVRSKEKGSKGIVEGQRYFNKEATREVLFSALRQKNAFSIVHLATHFQLNKGSGYQSFLLLGEQSKLPIAELYSHPKISFNGVDLLTVSACNTGAISAQSDGSEVESFAAIAQQKGAKAVLASLWAVNDRSTSELMQRFYRLWQQGKKHSKIAALQQAQLYFIQQAKNAEKQPCPTVIVPGMPACADHSDYPQQSHPYYWAAFTLMGNGA